MRKRLTEKFTKAKKGSLGYTLTEMLVVVGIIAAICAIAIPSIFAIRNMLRFATANNYAKSIFLAAQQNLTELRSDGGLGPVRSATGASEIPGVVTTFPDEYRAEYVYTVTGTEAFERVLPAGSVDAELRNDQIVIEYNPITGNVYSVFYFDKDAAALDLESQYESGALPREKSARRELMVGYYDGSGLNSAQIELEQTQAIVEFINGEEGIVQVKVPMPESFYGNFSEFAQGLNVSLTITGEWSMTQTTDPIQPLTLQVKTAGTQDGCTLAADGKTVVLSYVIDSLASRKSFVNFASNTQANTSGGAANSAASLTTLIDEESFIYNILPGENITIQADVTFTGEGSELVEIEPGILSGVNPMFEYLQPSGNNGYVLAISNGRNLQNLNAIAPTIADMVQNVTFVSDIYWNDTVAYYNNKYAGGSTYQTGAMVSGKHVFDEAPARALPYFVPIHNEKLFGTARFIFPGEGDGGLGDLINSILGALGFGRYTSARVPTLTDELDNRSGTSHASIQGNGHGVYNINIDSTKYQIPNEGKKIYVEDNRGSRVEKDLTGTFYATGENQIVDYCFTGLFGYVNTPINSLRVVNPIVKGYKLDRKTVSVPIYILGFPIGTTRENLYNNPATGALLGAGGFNTLITDCSTYIDKNARGYMSRNWGPYTYDADSDQNWYGVSGGGAVGGLVGYAKSHRSVTGELTDDAAHVAFSKCFAAVPVSGAMRTSEDKNFGYSNGVGALIGNSQLTNFYNCYASGDVLATGCMVNKTGTGTLAGLLEIFGVSLDLPYDGRTSWGAGGFVGTSHGTRYTNCFSTGNVSASTASSTAVKNLGAGGFVGFMSIDETFTYGNTDSQGKETVAQRTVFTDCYSVGMAVTNGSNYENFSGANGRIAFQVSTSLTYYVGDYFRLYAPHYVNERGTAPNYEDFYIYRDTYFLSNYHTDVTGQDNSSHCASPDAYASFTDMVNNHNQGSAWMADEIQEIKDIYLYRSYEWEGWDRVEVIHTYDTEYFQEEPELNRIYQELYAEGYSENDWESATASTTHPYSLTEGNRYPFTKLKGMDYYGDWPSKPSDVGLAYYETYDDTDKTHYFFDQNHSEYESLTLRSDINAIVKEDGYSIFSADDSDLRVTIGNVTAELKAERETYTVAQKTYHVFHLTDELMAQLPKDGEFYVKVTASHITSSDTYTMYYNPNVGLSHVNPVEGKLAAVKPDKAPTTIYVRSARQFKNIATLDGFWGEDTRYIQQLNIDASKYDWGTNVAVPKLTAIGADGEDTCFDADYSAGYTLDIGEEGRYKIAGFNSADLAMFGAIGENGSISNLIIECEDFTAGSDKAENAAILAAVNHGEISKVDIVVSGDVTLTATTNAGLLAGLTTGNITECAVTPGQDKTATNNQVATINVTVNAQNAGGLIGSVEGTAATADAEAELVAVNKASLTVNGELTLNGGAGNAGGLIGKASYMSAENLNVNINSLTGDSLYLAGLAGYVSNSSITGVVADDNGNNPVEVVVNSVASGNTEGYAAGGLGYAEHTTLTAIDVTTASVTGNIAAGFLGSSLDVDATNCDVIVTGAITGTTGAAGVAGVVGPQSVINDVPVRLSGVTVSGADAAGYALEVKGDAYVMGNSHVTLGSDAQTKTTISATGNAAGYAVTTAGSIGESNVVGFGAISGDQAAGYAVNVSGNIASCHVSPALANENYLGNANANLAVSGKTAAAGFAMTLAKDSTIANSYTLCSITAEGKVTTEGETPVEVTAAYGFVGTNNGTLNRCMNNVDIGDGYAFVGVNNGLVTTSYGWFGDGDRNNATLTKNEMTGSGKCYSSYFADLAPVNRTDKVVALYDADGNVSQITPSALQLAAISGFVGGYNEYPYQAMDESEVEYPYPMLRDHYGNWITPPQYAYGVAYYETYEDGTRKLQMVDLSNPALTEEGQKGITFINNEFDNSGKIVEAGYAKFYNNQMGEMEGKTFDVQIGDFTFDFYKIETVGVETIAATKSGTKAATIDTRFAKAIKVDESFGKNETFEVRTAEQLANIGAVAANFNQTHDIATTDVTSATIAANYVYNGNNLKLDITGQTKAWLTAVNGTVKDLNLTVDAVAANVFGNVAGTVENLNLTVPGAVSAPVFNNISGTVDVDVKQLGSIAANGALVGTTSGTFTTDDITTGEIAANGTIIGNVTGGTVTVGDITTGAVNGNVVTSVEGGTITTDAITTGDVTGAVFGGVTGGTVNTGAITTGKVGTAEQNANVFGAVSGGTVTVASISTDGKAVNGNVFASSAGDVTVTNGITAGDVNGAIFGAVSGGSVTTKNIQAGALTGKVFDEINANVTVSDGITAANVAGSADNWLAGSVKGGEVKLGNIQAARELNTTTTETNPEGTVTKTTTVTTYDAVPRVVGPVSGGSLTLGTVNLGKVTGTDGWLIASSSNANVTVGVVTVHNNEITKETYAPVGDSTENVPGDAESCAFGTVYNMIGQISGGTVTGSAVTLDDANINTNLFTGVASGATLRGFTVSDAGSMGASLIGSASGTIDDVNVTAANVASGFSSSGLLVNTLNAGASVTGCDVVVTNPVTVSAATFGGITGTANATLTNNKVTATLNVSGESATVGGLVGEMTGGSISGSTATGAITLASGTGDGKNYIVGGAVGKAGAGTSYSGVTATVKIDDTWGTPAFCDSVTGDVRALVSPNANGPVGQFVGYVDTGVSFDKCYGNGGSGYYFLGQVKPVSTETFGANTYGEFDEPWGSNTYREADQTKYEAAKAQYNRAGVTIANFDITLTDCYYTQGTASYQQLINNTKYYTDGTDGTVTQYQATKVDVTATFNGNDSLKISNFTSYTSKTKTNWYYQHTDGKYYPVWAKYDYYNGILSDGHGLDLWVDLDWNGDATDSVVKIQRYDRDHMRDGNTDINKSIGKTLYTPSELSMENGNYIIVGSDSHALTGSGTTTNFVAVFTADNQNLVSAIWTKDGNAWKQGSNYLNLSNAMVGTSSNNIISSVAVTGRDELSVSLNGGKYLTYSDGAFAYGNNPAGRINLYSVNSTFLYEMTFTNDRRGQIIASVPLTAASTVSEVSEDAEPVVTETEVTEATEPQVTE